MRGERARLATGRGRRAVALWGFCVIAAGGLTGCSAHNGLGTASASCFLALPAASSAVHGQGTLIGVRKFNAKTLADKLSARASASQGVPTGPQAPPTSFPMTSVPPASTPLSSVPGAPGAPRVHPPGYVSSRQRSVDRLLARQLEVFGNKEVCAVEYQGSYGPHSVNGAVDPTLSGSYALVIVPEKGGSPEIAFVVRRPLLSVSHL